MAIATLLTSEVGGRAKLMLLSLLVLLLASTLSTS
jgi:hypothetical protein